MDAVTDEEIEDIGNAMASIKEYQMIPADPGPLTAAYSKLILVNTHQTIKKLL